MSPLLLIGLAGTAEARGPKPCWMPNRMSYTGRNMLTYTPLAEARRQEARAAELERRKARDIRAGWLSLEIDRVTLGAADPANELVTVLRDGQELFRYEPPSGIAEQNPQIVGYWYNYAVVQLPEGTVPPFEVEVTDRLLLAKCTWTVDTDGVATLHSRREDDTAPDVAPAPVSTPPADRPNKPAETETR